jgi:putative ABC transport system permease protein
MIPPRWRKVFRDLWNNKSRTLLVVFSVAIGVLAFGGLFTARDVSMRNLAIQSDETRLAQIVIALSPFDDALVRWSARQSGVAAAQGVAVNSASLIAADSAYNLTLYAYGSYDSMLLNRIEAEDAVLPPNDGEILVERSNLRRLNVNIGDIVTVQLADGRETRLRLAGTVHDFSVRPGTINPNINGYVSLNTLYSLGLNAEYNRLLVNPAAAQSATDVARTLRSNLEDLGIPIRSLSVNEDGKYWMTDIFDGLTTILVVVGVVALFLSAFLVINTISGFIAQQKKQIGIMKIIGASRGQITTVYLVMVAVFGAAALLIALPASVLLARALVFFVATQMLNFDIMTLQIPLLIIVLQVFMAFITPLVAAWVPVSSGTAIPAAQAISDYLPPTRTDPVGMLLARLSGLPRPALLAIRNTFRNRGRLFITTFTLIVAGAFFMGIMNVRAGLNANLDLLTQMSEFDIQISLTRAVNTQGIIQRLQDQEGVQGAEGWVNASVAYVRPDGTLSSNLSLTGLPHDSIFIDPPLIKGAWLPSYTYVGRSAAVVTDSFASAEAVALGDSIQLRLNGADTTWQVVGIISGLNPQVYGYLETVSRLDNALNQTDSVLIRTAPGMDARSVADDLDDYLDIQRIAVGQIAIRQDVVEGAVGGFNRLIIILLGMAVLIGVIAGLGLTGTMSLNVLERTREIGVMRALGGGTWTIRAMYVGEGAFIGLLSWVLALPLSIAMTLIFGNLLGQVIFNNPLVFIYTALGPALWLILVLVVSAIASIAPAQRASQISIREALSYE